MKTFMIMIVLVTILDAVLVNAQISNGTIKLEAGNSWYLCSTEPTSILNYSVTTQNIESLTPTVGFGFVLTQNFVTPPTNCTNGIITNILSAAVILESLGNSANFASQKQLSCTDQCVEYCDGNTTSLQSNNWCVLVTNPITVPTLFYTTITFKDPPPPPPSPSSPPSNEGDGKIIWNRELVFCTVLIWIVGHFLEIRYLVTVSTQQLQGTPNFGYFINNHKFYDTSEPCTEGILANAMPAVNLLEDMSLNTTFYSWNAVSCYQDCVTTCPKTDNDGLNYTTWCLLVSNIKNTVDYVNITLSFDSPSASTSLPGTVPVYNSGSKETVLSVWFLTAFGLTGILGGLGLFIL
ncbi:4550_t:CDS:2 [Paraglomus occultum]|uniref:4550_t:CDS:1 n=1 Tax=Paraglomus occultum TaxID=144539 RepID=A0A9N9G731_9GLOM|nr:4550_t:CDS:2 [Paraglomus occultum]